MKNEITYTCKELTLPEGKLPTGKEQAGDKKEAQKPAYRVVMQSGCDFAVEKSMGRGRKKQLLVILLSQQQYYIKRKGEPAVELTLKGLKGFLKELSGELPLVKVSWISGLRKKAWYLEQVWSILHDDVFVKMARKNSAYFSCDSDLWMQGMDMEEEGFGMNRPFWMFPHGFADSGECMGPDALAFNAGGGEYSKSLSIFDNPYIYPFSNNNAILIEAGRLWDPGFDPIFEQGDVPGSVLEVFERFYEDAPSFYLWLINELAKRRGCSKKELLSEGISKRNKERMLLESYYSLLLIAAVFGDKWAKEAVSQYYDNEMNSPIGFEPLYDLLYKKDRSCRSYRKLEAYKKYTPARKFHGREFLNYLFAGAAAAGFESDLSEYLSLWNQSLTLQELIYTKINEKYPGHLVSYCYQLNYLAAKNRNQIQKNMWDRAIEPMRKYEYQGERYQILCPDSTEALNDEAAQQHNCVASYAELIRNGETMVFFMRSKEKKDKSLVTIELKNNTVEQVCREYNQNPTAEQMVFVREWAKEMGFTVWKVFEEDEDSFWELEEDDELE